MFYLALNETSGMIPKLLSSTANTEVVRLSLLHVSMKA